MGSFIDARALLDSGCWWCQGRPRVFRLECCWWRGAFGLVRGLTPPGCRATRKAQGTRAPTGWGSRVAAAAGTGCKPWQEPRRGQAQRLASCHIELSRARCAPGIRWAALPRSQSGKGVGSVLGTGRSGGGKDGSQLEVWKCVGQCQCHCQHNPDSLSSLPPHCASISLVRHVRGASRLCAMGGSGVHSVCSPQRQACPGKQSPPRGLARLDAPPFHPPPPSSTPPTPTLMVHGAWCTMHPVARALFGVAPLPVTGCPDGVRSTDELPGSQGRWEFKNLSHPPSHPLPPAPTLDTQVHNTPTRLPPWDSSTRITTGYARSPCFPRALSSLSHSTSRHSLLSAP